MTETQTPKETVKKAAKTAAGKSGGAIVDMPEMFREFTEKGIGRTKDTYARMRNAAEESTDMLEDAYLQATRGTAQLNLKAIEALRMNVNASFDYALALIGTKTLSEALELSTSHVRRQFDALTAQSKELSALAQKLAMETVEPIQSSVTKSLKAD